MGAKKGRGAIQAPLIVTDKDIQIMQFLATVRVGTARDVTYALFSPGSLTAIRSRMSALAGGADYQPRCLLYRFPLPSVGGNPVRAFCLGQKGSELLARELDQSLDGSFRPYKKARIVSISFLRHILASTRCVVAARMFARARPERPEMRLRDCRLSDEMGRMRPPLPVIPDVWMRWERSADGRTLGLWVEVDCATQYQRAWAKRFTARVEYLCSEAYKRTFGVPPLLCYVVVGQTAQAGKRRLESLSRWSMAELKARRLTKWAGSIRLTSVLLDGVYEQGLLEQPVWYRVDQPAQPIPLFRS